MYLPRIHNLPAAPLSPDVKLNEGTVGYSLFSLYKDLEVE